MSKRKVITRMIKADKKKSRIGVILQRKQFVIDCVRKTLNSDTFIGSNKAQKLSYILTEVPV